PQLVGRHAEGLFDLAQVGLDEVQLARGEWFFAEQRDVILAEDASRQIADEYADLRAEHHPRCLLERKRRSEASAAEALAVELLDWLEQIAEIDDVSADPALAVQHLDRRVAEREIVAHVAGDGLLDLAEHRLVL